MAFRSRQSWGSLRRSPRPIPGCIAPWKPCAAQHFPGAPVVPAVLGGFTDSHFLRDLGITAYGFVPVVIPFEDEGGLHGNNERISVDNVRRGVTMMREILRRVAVN